MDYNYREEVYKDVRAWVNENINLRDWEGKREELEEKLNDDLWVEDRVTGNSSGSYTFNTYTAEDYICHNWDLLAEAMEELPVSADEVFKRGAEFADSIIRCYLLGGAIARVLDEVYA